MQKSKIKNQNDRAKSKKARGAGFRNFAFVRKRAGVVLLLVVVILAALLSTGMAIFAVVFGEARISGELVDSFRAIYAADLGMERMLYCDRTAPDPDCDPGTCVGDAGQCTYPQPPAEFVDLPLSLFPSNSCAEAQLVRLGSGNTQTDVIGEFPCGSATAVRRALRTNYQK